MVAIGLIFGSSPLPLRRQDRPRSAHAPCAINNRRRRRRHSNDYLDPEKRSIANSVQAAETATRCRKNHRRVSRDHTPKDAAFDKERNQFGSRLAPLGEKILDLCLNLNAPKRLPSINS
jgi:hypothetical protein